MDSITLKCPITIKAKVTETLKATMTAEMQEAIKKADMELQQIEFQAKRIMAEQAKIDAQGLVSLRQQIEEERQKRMELKSHIAEQIKGAAALEIGSEIVQGTLEQMVEIKIGDDLHKIMGSEILIEDGKVIAFRN